MSLSRFVRCFFIFGKRRRRLVSIPVIMRIGTSALAELAVVEDEVVVVVVFIAEVEVYLAGDELL